MALGAFIFISFRDTAFNYIGTVVISVCIFINVKFDIFTGCNNKEGRH